MRESPLPLVAAALIGLGLAVVIAWPRGRTDGAPAGRARAPAPVVSSASSAAAPSGSSVAPVPSATAVAPAPVTGQDALCPLGMTYVEGRYCPFVAHRCAAWLGPAPDSTRERATARCERFADRLICEGRPSSHAFCIDRYEYPNIAGMKPAVRVSYRDAVHACEQEGKRLCAADEWQLACEGERTLPYPTGLTREPSICNLDRRPRQSDPVALAEPHDVSVEIERLDQRMPSGALADCVSPFGVFDMSGNVAEWVHDRAAESADRGYPTALAGGHWGRAPATCRQLDHSHRATFRRHDVGFRCCADPVDGRTSRRLMPKDYRLPKRRTVLPPAPR